MNINDHPGDVRCEKLIDDLERHFVGVLNMLEATYAKGLGATATEVFDRFTSNQNQVEDYPAAVNPSELPRMLLLARRCLQYADNFPGEPCMRVKWKDVDGYEDGYFGVIMDGTAKLSHVEWVLASLDIPVSIQFDIEDRPAFIMRRENGCVETVRCADADDLD